VPSRSIHGGVGRSRYLLWDAGLLPLVDEVSGRASFQLREGAVGQKTLDGIEVCPWRERTAGAEKTGAPQPSEAVSCFLASRGASPENTTKAVTRSKPICRG